MTRVREPQRYTVDVHRPDDFEEFWAATLQQVAAVPLRPSFDYVPERSTEEIAVYDVHYDSWEGVRISGWFAVPRPEYLPPPYPALMMLPGYISEPTVPKHWAKQGYAAFAVAPRASSGRTSFSTRAIRGCWSRTSWTRTRTDIAGFTWMPFARWKPR
nr:acetylxylan esterase [Fodinicola feengrottensis]